MDLKERFERLKKHLDKNRNQGIYFDEELFRNIHFFLKFIKENENLRYFLQEEEIYYNNYITNIGYDSLKKRFIKNTKNIFTRELNKNISIKRESASLLATRSHVAFQIFPNEIIDKIKHYSNLQNPIFYDYEIIYNLIKILEMEGILTIEESNKIIKEGKFIVYELDEQLKNKELINFKYINKIYNLTESEISMKNVSKNFDQEFLNYNQKYLFDTLYINLEFIYSKINYKAQTRSSFLHVVAKFRISTMLYKYSDYLKLINKNKENKNSKIEELLKKEFNMFCLNEDFITLAEVELGNGRLDALLNEIGSNNIIIYEAKQIGFKKEEISPAIIRKSITDAKKQVDNYHAKLKIYPKIKSEGHLIIFSGKDFKLEKDTFIINNFSYIIHIIPIIGSTPSTQEPVQTFNINEIFSATI